jgi:hypothetical protein
METLRNWGDKISLFWLHWKNFSWQHWLLFFPLFTLCSTRVSALVIVLKYSPYEKWGNRRLVRFWCAFNWNICDKTATLLVVSRATVSEVMSAYTDHGKTSSAKGEQWAKVNTDRKRSSYIEKGCLEKLRVHNCCSTGGSGTEYSSWRSCFHKSCLTWASQIQHPR